MPFPHYTVLLLTIYRALSRDVDFLHGREFQESSQVSPRRRKKGSSSVGRQYACHRTTAGAGMLFYQ